MLNNKSNLLKLKDNELLEIKCGLFGGLLSIYDATLIGLGGYFGWKVKSFIDSLDNDSNQENKQIRNLSEKLRRLSDEKIEFKKNMGNCIGVAEDFFKSSLKSLRSVLENY